MVPKFKLVISSGAQPMKQWSIPTRKKTAYTGVTENLIWLSSWLQNLTSGQDKVPL